MFTCIRFRRYEWLNFFRNIPNLKFILYLILIVNSVSLISFGKLRNRQASDNIENKLAILDKYDGKVLIGGELEKYSDELFEGQSFEVVINTLSKTFNLERMFNYINQLSNLSNPMENSVSVVRRGQPAVEVSIKSVLNQYLESTDESVRLANLSILFSIFRSNKNGSTFSMPIINSISDVSKNLIKMQFGYDGDVVEFRHKRPFSKIREFYNNIVSVNSLFGLDNEEVDHIHLSIFSRRDKVSNRLGSIDKNIDIEPVAIELNKLRYLESIKNSLDHSQISLQLLKPTSKIVYTSEILGLGIYRLVSKNRLEIRVLRSGVLDELEFHLNYLTMDPEIAISELRSKQIEILKDSKIVDLIRKYRPDTEKDFKFELKKLETIHFQSCQRLFQD